MFTRNSAEITSVNTLSSGNR